MFPALTRVHSQTFWTRCRFVMWLRRGAKPMHTIPNLATPRLGRLHGRDPAAQSWRGPGGDCLKTASQETAQFNRVAVNPLHTIVLGVTKHQTVVLWEMALALRWICQVQYLKQSIYPQNNHNNYNKPKNSNLKKMKYSHNFLVRVYCCHWNSNSRPTPQLMSCFTARTLWSGSISGIPISACTDCLCRVQYRVQYRVSRYRGQMTPIS